MFKFLKIFGKKKEKKAPDTQKINKTPIKKVNITKLEAFYNDFEESYKHKFLSDMQEYEEIVKSHKKSILLNLEKLKNAKLRNPNLTIKELNFVTGNKSAFITFVQAFSDNIHFSSNFKEILEFSKVNDKIIKDFLDNTKRQVAILSNYFANELKKVMIAIGDYKKMVEDFDVSLKAYKFDKLFDIQNEIEVLKRLKTDYSFHGDILLKLNNKLTTQEKFKKEILNGIENLKNSHEMKKIDSMQLDLNKLFSKQNNLELQFINYMAALSKPLKKYAHISFEHSDILEDYINEPIKALLNDKNLSLISILHNLKKAIDNDSISIKNTKKAKKIISEMNQEFCKKFKADYTDLNSRIKNLEDLINNDVTNSQINELNIQLHESKVKIEDLKQKIYDTTEILKKIKVDAVAKGIEKDLKDNFSKTIKIDVSN
jgi:uncharacterized coiled-coil protein SlyX